MFLSGCPVVHSGSGKESPVCPVPKCKNRFSLVVYDLIHKMTENVGCDKIINIICCTAKFQMKTSATDICPLRATKKL